MFISIKFTKTSTDKMNKNRSESHRFKIYVQNVHHSHEHVQSNDYATAGFHGATGIGLLVAGETVWSPSWHEPHLSAL